MNHSMSIFLILLTTVQAKSEISLRWDLPHDRAAVFKVIDGSTGANLREFWLLGCELDGRIEAQNSTDIPLRFIFQLPKEKVVPNTPWQTRQRIFCEFPEGLAPLEILGTCRARPPKSLRVEDILKASARGKKDKSEPIEAVIVEGQYQVFRGNWTNEVAGSFEKSPSATFISMTVVRLTDGAILGATFVWSGRTEDYSGNYSEATVARRTISREYVFENTFLNLKKEDLKNRIDKAVERGSKWLHTVQSVDGKFTEPLLQNDKWSYAKDFLTSLSLMALTHSGISSEDKSIRSGFSFMESHRQIQTWDIGLYLMALESKYLPLTYYEDISSYSEEKAREHVAKSITQKDKAIAEHLARTLLGYQGKTGGFGYSDATVENIQTTQFALLGLKSASRLGVNIPPNVWRRTVRYFETSTVTTGASEAVTISFLDGRKEQKKNAFETCWLYMVPLDRKAIAGRAIETNGTRTMTALASLAVCRSELERLKELDDDTKRTIDDLIWGGLAWWARRPGLRAAQQEGCWQLAALTYFYQWSVERAAVYLGIERINGHSWYHEGAAHILAAQHPDGHWDGSRGLPIVDTACALLFLKRATIPVETPAGAGKKGVATDGEKKPATTDPEK